jgi:hypothetical protein
LGLPAVHRTPKRQHQPDQAHLELPAVSASRGVQEKPKRARLGSVANSIAFIRGPNPIDRPAQAGGTGNHAGFRVAIALGLVQIRPARWGVQMAEVDFESSSTDQIIDAYWGDGCVLLRNFVRLESLTKLIALVGKLYEEIESVHVFPHDLKERGLPDFHEYLFAEKHYEILERLFGNDRYFVNNCTATRKVDSARADGQWQAPLGPHLDAFFHPFAFTVNFWVPFRACGVDAPSLGVVRAPFAEAAVRAGYDGGSEPHGDHGEWNFARFFPEMFEWATSGGAAKLERMRAVFGERVWTPAYALGDAMMLSNWTFHFTHVTAAMDQRRGNVELRFSSEQSLRQIASNRGQL